MASSSGSSPISLREKAGLLLVALAGACFLYMEQFAAAENPWGYIALLLVPVFGLPGAIILLLSKNLRRPAVLSFIVLNVFFALSNVFSK